MKKSEYIRLFGIMSKETNCEHCHQEERFQIIHGRYWFVLFFIPLIPLSGQYYLECPSCNTRYPIEKKKAKEYLNSVHKERKNHTRRTRR